MITPHTALKFKKLDEDAVIPERQNPQDAGLDLTAITYEFDEEKRVHKYGTGLAVEIPQGYVGFLFPRSSIYKTTLSLCNSVGVIDSGYRGEIMFFFRNSGFHRVNGGDYGEFKYYDVGERVGQLIVMSNPIFSPVEAQELAESERGAKGFGSSGR